MNGDMKLFKNFQYTLTLEPIEYNIFKEKNGCKQWNTWKFDAMTKQWPWIGITPNHNHFQVW